MLEIAKNGLLDEAAGGRLLKIAPDGTRSVVAEKGLLSPTSVLAGLDGSVYVSNCGTCAGAGTVLRFHG